MNFHQPVLIDKVIECLNISPGKSYIDATIGGGGHSEKILQLGGRVIGIDQDAQALEYTAERLQAVYRDKLILVRDNFINMDKIIENLKINKIDGVLFDLGTSRFQLLSPSRGFSYNHDARLDMRMDNSISSLSAYELINSFSQEKLTDIFIQFGEEELAEHVARAIIRTRRHNPIKTTGQLTELVKSVYSEANRRSKSHPQVKVFQAIRIAVNNELENLKIGLAKAIKLVAKNGRVVVLTYHSLEDRIVKQIFSRDGLHNLTKKPLHPNYDEVSANPSARSAKLRAAQVN